MKREDIYIYHFKLHLLLGRMQDKFIQTLSALLLHRNVLHPLLVFLRNLVYNFISGLCTMCVG